MLHISKWIYRENIEIKIFFTSHNFLEILVDISFNWQEIIHHLSHCILSNSRDWFCMRNLWYADSNNFTSCLISREKSEQKNSQTTENTADYEVFLHQEAGVTFQKPMIHNE